MATNISLTLGNLPTGYCFTNPQQFMSDIFNLLSGSFPGSFTGVVKQQALPAVGDQDKLWVRTDSSGRPVSLYLYQGSWIWPHPIPASSNMGSIWFGTEAALWAHESGSGLDPAVDIPTATSGSFWKRNTDMNFKFPIGIGTNATTYDGNPATVIAQGGVGGEERHTLVVSEMPAHTHDITFPGAPAAAGGYQIGGNFNGPATFTSTSRGGDLSHQNLPPYRGIIFAVRTARQFFVAS